MLMGFLISALYFAYNMLQIREERRKVFTTYEQGLRAERPN